MKKILLVSLFLLLAGSISYCIYNEKILIFFPEQHNHLYGDQQLQSTEIPLFTWTSQQTYHIEHVTFLNETSEFKNFQNLITKWIQTQEHQAHPLLSVQKASLSDDHKDIFVHFSHYPFDKDASTYTKLAWIQGLLKTIHTHNKNIEFIYFFVDDKHLKDYELDFSRPWPIEGFLEKN